MEDKVHRNVERFPPDWWRTSGSCAAFIDYFRKYIVSLFISFQTKQGSFQRNFTGFLLVYENNLLWVTAGHVIESIKEVISNPDIKIQTMVWLDNHNILKASGIVMGNKNLTTFTSSINKIDIGAVILGNWEVQNLSHNPNASAFTQSAWVGNASSTPEGYYLVGYPEEFDETINLGKEGGKVRKRFEAHAVCLPVERLRYEDLSAIQKKVWQEENAFYGKVLEFNEGELVKNIVGMSGGPILSIERDQGKFRYRLFGIQSSWFRSSKIIKGELIENLLTSLELSV